MKMQTQPRVAYTNKQSLKIILETGRIKNYVAL